jgi:hypothetical protein
MPLQCFYVASSSMSQSSEATYIALSSNQCLLDLEACIVGAAVHR